MFLISARGKIGTMKVAVTSATDVLIKIRDFEECKFAAVVFDDRGEEQSLEEIEAKAAEERSVESRPTGLLNLPAFKAVLPAIEGGST